MTIVTDLQSDVAKILSYGDLVRLKYYNVSYTGSYYDDDVNYTQSGSDLWESGLVQPLNSKQGSNDSLLLQQGKILIDDKKVYFNGDVQTSGLGKIKVGIGSPTPQENEVLQDGNVIVWDVNGTPIYKKVYIRHLTDGSFIGE